MDEGESQGFSLILWQLQQYQHVIRKWDRHLGPYEFKVVMQILDRTIGWQRNEATFRPHVMLNGDRMYAGFGGTISRSKLMKVLHVLEQRGIIIRRPDQYRPGLKSYSVNLDWSPENLDDTNLTPSAEYQHAIGSDGGGSVEEGGVRQRHSPVFPRDIDVSNGDSLETYRENAILDGNLENSISVDPRPSASDQRALGIQPETGLVSGKARFPTASAINPPPRKRRVG